MREWGGEESVSWRETCGKTRRDLAKQQLTSSGEALEMQPVRKTLLARMLIRGEAVCRSRKFLTDSSCSAVMLRGLRTSRRPPPTTPGALTIKA